MRITEHRVHGGELAEDAVRRRGASRAPRLIARRSRVQHRHTVATGLCAVSPRDGSLGGRERRWSADGHQRSRTVMACHVARCGTGPALRAAPWCVSWSISPLPALAELGPFAFWPRFRTITYSVDDTQNVPRHLISSRTLASAGPPSMHMKGGRTAPRTQAAYARQR